jgi:hypothetical protein
MTKNVPRCEVDMVGDKRWFIEGHKLHREDGPAVEYTDGTKMWLIDDNFHREDGPAIDRATYPQWWYQGHRLENVHSQEEFERWLRLKAFW